MKYALMPLTLILALLLAACGPGADSPVDPVWGKQPCSYCKMVVGERDFAAQMTTSDHKRHYYDDIGCLIGHEDEAKPKVVKRWVRQAGQDRWIPAETAVYEGGKRTPMDFGFVAHDKGPGVPYAEMAAQVRQKLSQRSGGHVP